MSLNGATAGTYQILTTFNYTDPTRTSGGAETAATNPAVTPGGTDGADNTVPGNNYAASSSTQEGIVINSLAGTTADPGRTKSGPASVEIGEAVEYILNITNNGSTNLTSSITVTENVPVEIGTVTWSCSLVAGTTEQLTNMLSNSYFTNTPTSVGALISHTAVNTQPTDTGVGIQMGSKNYGPNVVIQASLPVDAARGVGDINNWLYNNVNTTVVFAITAYVTPLNGTATNTVNLPLLSSVTDNNPANNTARDIDSIKDLANIRVAKTKGVSTLLAAAATAYTLTVANSFHQMPRVLWSARRSQYSNCMSL